MSLTFDTSLVPLPAHRFQLATRKVNGTGMDYLGDRVHRGIVFHRAYSNVQSLEIAVGWLLRPSTRGLTDGFIDHRSGEMVIINPMKVMFPKAVPAGWRDMAGWANGPYSTSASWPDGRAFRNRYGGRLGASVINQDLESMEVTGDYHTPISEACKRTLTQWAAARAQYHKIPWNTFPINPRDGLTMMYGHREFCGDGWKVCPGSVVWAFITGEMIDRVKAVLKAAQTGAVVPVPEPTKPDTTIPSSPYATPSIPAFITNENAAASLEDGNGITLFWTDRQYVTVRETRRLQYAGKDAKDVGPPIPAGQDINIAFVFTSHDGREYGLTPYGTRVALDDVKIVADSPVDGIKGALKSAL